ncbi:MAG TPA: tetraacyldisaccharide 4'-kinase [Gemmatimonadaceae bacterium]|nr:tetraacyldisaccharide 4'-kinase [Gemmatimonadaceae bacterium]
MPDIRRMVETAWTGRGRRARTLRTLLTPLEMAYRGAVAMRSWLYDAGLFPAENFSVGVVSVGNLSVGGTGKTPVAAWIARRLTEKGIKPGIVLRGYGGDETLVHERLNAHVPVIAASNRPRGIREAIAQGADVVILDDAFQHRRAARDADVLLVDADSWSGAPRLLPAGPWREPLRSARRASLIIITRKTADRATVEAARRAVESAAPRVPIAVVHLAPGELRSTATGQSLPLHALRGADLTAIAAIARPESFFRQLTELGAVVRPHSFADHHAFTRKEARYLAAQASSSDFVVCTLKDAVKLESMWPAEAGSLWYVSQRLKIEDGQANIDRMLDGLLSNAHSN